MEAIVETTRMSTKGQLLIPKHIKEFRKLRSEVKNKLSEDEINEIIHKVR
jgi:bifunctional DNA-binding transcriptional regulator/antitoxin component of YhaV-PrlF toxin-antitoxin module